ncbi:LppX_LprAFG lipoprotein [Streptomyces sp. NPDC126497]|uniref:LppX_LprAFG lipoprotein n=1 Tax=Streptomyces sp. NPDC126497 TaxID=3155313 RepID=UPI003327C8BD
MRHRGTRAGAIAVAAVMGSILTGCGDEGGATGARDGASPGASRSDGGRDQDTTAVRAAYDKTAEAESARMTIKTKIDAEGRTVTSEGRGVLDLAEGDSVMTVTAEGESIEQRVVDEILYQKAPGQDAPGGKPWVGIDLEKVAAQQGVNGQGIGDPARTAAYAKAITDEDVTEVGTEEIDGVNTTRYRVSVDVAELPGGDRMRKQLGPTLPMQVWVDDEGRLRRQQMDMTVRTGASASAKPDTGAAPQQLRMSTVMEFSDFGAEVDAEAPPAGQVADMTDRVLRQGGRRG